MISKWYKNRRGKIAFMSVCLFCDSSSGALHLLSRNWPLHQGLKQGQALEGAWHQPVDHYWNDKATAHLPGVTPLTHIHHNYITLYKMNMITGYQSLMNFCFGSLKDTKRWWMDGWMDGWMSEFNITFIWVRPYRQTGATVMRWTALVAEMKLFSNITEGDWTKVQRLGA